MEKAGLGEPSLPGEEWLMECDEVLVTMTSCAGGAGKYSVLRELYGLEGGNSESP